MYTTQEIKKEIEFNSELTQLMDVLKGVAAAEFRALEKKKDRFTSFKDAFEGFFSMIDFDLINHPLAKDSFKKLAVMMITSDEGFMGGLNSRVISSALAYPGFKEAKLIVVGNKGAFLLDELDYDFVKFPCINAQNAYEQALNIKDYIIKENKNKQFSRLVVFYPKPVFFAVHKINNQVLLPCSDLVDKTRLKVDQKTNLIIESPIEGILEYLMEAWIVQKLMEIFEDSKLSEFSARTVHLEESYQVLVEQDKELNLKYLKVYHDFLDQGMRESFAIRMVNVK